MSGREGKKKKKVVVDGEDEILKERWKFKEQKAMSKPEAMGSSAALCMKASWVTLG